MKLTATNSCGSVIGTRTNYISVCALPVAGFTGAPTSGPAPLTVTFTNTSTGATAWSWDFGDGGMSTLQNPSHTYNAAGTYTVTLTATNSCGPNTMTRSSYISVCALPVTNFTGSPTSGPAPLTVNFTDQTTGSPTAWSWDFGDGGTSTLQNPSHTYTAAGTYTVKLTATNSCGSVIGTRPSYISVCALPVTNFTGSPTSGPAPLSVIFTDQTTGSPTTWSWDFGDGGTSTLQNPSHIYTSPGTYTVKLTATNSCGPNTMTRSSYISVCALPVTNFTGSPTSGPAPLTVNFSDQTTGSPTAWSWDFGDGGTSTLQNPSHTYTAAGTYTVKLTATNSCGSVIGTRSGYISVCALPIANFTTDKTSGPAPLAVTFTNTSTGATSYIWDFADGGTSTLQNPSHTYNTAGIYTVTLTAMNSCGLNIKTGTIIVCGLPVTNFTGSPTSGPAPLTVNFTDQTTGSPTAWSWDFGDGGTGTLQNPSHTYTSAGTYTVKLTATNSCGSVIGTRTNYISVCALPVTNFTADKTSGPAPLTVNFTDQTTGSPTAWSWDFGDGGTGTLQNPSHTYTSAGTYTVKLTATNSCGSVIGTRTNYISVCALPVTNFTANPTSGTAPLNVTFTDTSTGSPTFLVVGLR